MVAASSWVSKWEIGLYSWERSLSASPIASRMVAMPIVLADLSLNLVRWPIRAIESLASSIFALLKTLLPNCTFSVALKKFAFSLICIGNSLEQLIKTPFYFIYQTYAIFKDPATSKPIITIPYCQENVMVDLHYPVSDFISGRCHEKTLSFGKWLTDKAGAIPSAFSIALFDTALSHLACIAKICENLALSIINALGSFFSPNYTFNIAIFCFVELSMRQVTTEFNNILTTPLQLLFKILSILKKPQEMDFPFDVFSESCI